MSEESHEGVPRHIQNHWGVPDEVPEGPWRRKRELAEVARDLVEAIVRSEAPVEVLGQVAEALARERDRLRSHKSKSLADIVRDGDVLDNPSYYADRSPVMGCSNPLAPPLRFRLADGQVRGDVIFSDAYEGPPGMVHGGHVSAVFDHALGFTWMEEGLICMTGRLTTSFREPTPVGTPLRIEAWRTGYRGKQPTAAARLVIVDGDVVTAEARGIMVPLDTERVLRLIME